MIISTFRRAVAETAIIALFLGIGTVVSGIAGAVNEKQQEFQKAESHIAEASPLETEEAVFEKKEVTPPSRVEEKPRKEAPHAERREKPVVRTMRANVSAYTKSADETGGNGTGTTASGRRAVAGRTVAMDGVPMGTKIRMDGRIYVVEDCFGGGYSDRVDVYMDSKAEAIQFGRQYKTIEILG